MSNSESSKKHRQAVDSAKERIALFKAAWSSKSKYEKAKHDISKTFACSANHVLCKPIEPVACECERRPKVKTEPVDLYTCDSPLCLVVSPELDANQPYLDLLHHSPFHRTITAVDEQLVTTFADIAAAAGNLDLLKHLFDSPEPCQRAFYSTWYSYLDPIGLLRLFAHALNGGCEQVVMFLVEKFNEQLTSDVKMAVLEIGLWLATTEKKLESCFQRLVLSFGVNIVNNNNTFCPLRLTCMYDDADAAGFLIDNGADMHRENSEGCTVVYHAYKYGRYTFGLFQVLRVMLDKGFGVEGVMVRGSHFSYPLMYTFIHHTELELVQLLVTHGYSVNTPMRVVVDDKERAVTPLMHAIDCKCFNVAQWLVDQGADVNQRSFVSPRNEDDSWTPLHAATTTDSLTLVRLLVNHGARVDVTTATGETIVSLAVDRAKVAQITSLDMLAYLLQINAPVQSIPGMSFLVKSGLEEAVQNEWTMLDLAACSGSVDVVDALVKSRHFCGPTPVVSAFLHSVIKPVSSQQRRALTMIEQAASQVPPLQVLCVDRLRKACGVRLQGYVKETVMPARLRSLLLLEHLWGPLDRGKDQEENTCIS